MLRLLLCAATWPLLAAPKVPLFFERAGDNEFRAGAVRIAPAEIRFRGAAMRLAGANPRAQLRAAGPLPGRSNYFLGRDPARWTTSVQHYSRVEARDVWSGIDLAWHGTRDALEYDFTVRPGADPSAIRLRFHHPVRIGAAGELLAGPLRQRPPRIWQDGQPITGGYEVLGPREAGFAIGPYDRRRPLLIDPIVELTTVFGGTDDDRVSAVAFDPSGNIFIAGHTSSRSFPLSGALQTTQAGDYDVFVMKLNPSATVVLFSTFLGGSGEDLTFGLAVDAQGNPYICGVTRSPNFPTTSGVFQGQSSGGRDAFIARLNSAGNLLLASTFLGSSADEQANAIALDAAGNVYVTGSTRSAAFPTTPGAFRTGLTSASEVFVSKLDGSLARLIYSTYIGGNQDDFGQGIAVAPAGQAYITGQTKSPNFPITQNAAQPIHRGAGDAFLVRFNTAGTAVEYSSYLGGSREDIGNAIAVDSAGAVYLAGNTASPDFLSGTAGPSPFLGGNFDGMLATFQFPVAAGANQLADATYQRAVMCCNPGGTQVFSALALVRGADGKAQEVHTLGFTDTALSASPGSSPDARTLYPDCPRNGLLRASFSPNGQMTAYGCAGGAGFGTAIAARAGATLAAGTTGLTRDERNALSDLLLVFLRDPDQFLTRPASADQDNHGVAGDPVSTATGELFETVTDLDLGGRPRLALQRHYASFLAETGVLTALGVNWMHNFEARLSLTGSVATVLLFRGKSAGFQRAGGVWTLATAEQRAYALVEVGDNFQFLDPTARLIYTFNRSGALTRIEDRNGNALTLVGSPFGPASVTDGLGRTLTFTYERGGRLTRVADHTGRAVSFAYSDRDLASATGVDGKTTRYEYARAGLLSAVTRPAGNKPLSQTFDAQGRVVRQADSRGNATVFDYPATETRITDPLQGGLRHVHQGLQNLTGATDAEGRAIALAYDASNRRTSVTDRAGAALLLEYDSAGNVIAYTDTLGNRTRFVHTAQPQGRFTFYNLTRVDYADGTSAGMTYDAAGNVLSYTDPAGRRWTCSYDARGRLNTATNPAGGVTSWQYNPDGTLASYRSPTGEALAFAYDELKRPVRVSEADGSTRSVAYDAAGRLVRLTDALGRSRLFAYDDNGNLRSEIDPAGRAITFAYDTDDRLATASDRLGGRTEIRWNELGLVTSVTNPAGESTTYSWDRNRRLTAITDAASKATRASYTAEGVPATFTDAAGHTWSYTADRMGRTTRVTMPLGRTFDTAYDRLGRVTSTTDPLGQATAYTYDSRGNLVGITAPGSITTTMARNDFGRVTELRDPNGNRWRYTYDAGGRLTARTDPLSRRVSYAYDARGRLESVTFPSGAATFTHDAAGNLLARSYSDGTEIAWQYDQADRVTIGTGVALVYDAVGRVVQSNGLALARDAVGRATSVTYAPDKTVRYNYDARGLVTRVTDWVGGATELVWDDARQLVSLTRPNGAETRYGYDGDGRLISIQDGGYSIQLTRDAGDRVITAERNLPLQPVFTDEIKEFSYDAANQPINPPRVYQFDLAGRLIGHGEGGLLVYHSYDALGARTARNSQSYVYNYGFDSQTLSIVRESAQDRRYYVYLPSGALLHSIDAASDARRYYHFDEAGNTTTLTDDSGRVTDAYAYGPHGELVTRSGETENPFTWRGQYGGMQEAEGLYCLRQGFWDAGQARFLSADNEPRIREAPAAQSPPCALCPATLQPALPATETAQRKGQLHKLPAPRVAPPPLVFSPSPVIPSVARDLLLRPGTAGSSLRSE